MVSLFLGTLASVADAERAGLALSLEHNRDNDQLLLLTDSMAAYNSALNLAAGNPPRSGLEIRLKQALTARRNMDTAISWVRSHIGIPGNEIADRAADYRSHYGPVAGSPNITTFEGLRAHGKAIRREARSQTSFGLGNKIRFNRRALSAYTWMRTNKGPQRQWLHHIRKIDSPNCDCSDTPQSGDHVVFSCPLHRIARRALLGPGDHSWESLDHPRYDPEETDDDGERTDLVEEFFSYIFAHFT